jgi:archaemetzincin
LERGGDGFIPTELISITPIGKVERMVLGYLKRSLEGVFGTACRIGDPIPVPDFAFNRSRGQYSAEAILGQIHVEEGERVLGVVDLDLYVPGLNFVFGLADLSGKRALIALPRLRQSFYGMPEDDALFLERSLKEAVHELGHTYGLGHCPNRKCVMAFSNSISHTDLKGCDFCPSCLSILKG